MSYQCIPGADLLKVLRLYQQQITQCMKYIKELGNQWTLKLAYALAILVHIADSAHGARRIELHCLQMIVDDAMESGSEFCQHILQIFAIDAFLNLHNDGLQILHNLQTGLKEESGNISK